MRRRYGTISRLMIIILALNLVFPTSGSVSVLAAAKAPKLSKASKIIEIKKGFKLKIKKNKAKKIIKTKWSLTKKSKSLVSLLNKKKKSVRVLAFDVVGEAKVKAKVTYQMGSKTKTKTMKCRVFIQDTSPVTPAPDIDFTYTPAASSTPAPASSSAPAVKGTLTFNANSNMFEIAFAEAVQCAYNPDSTDTSGNKEWTTSAGAVASIFWSGVTAYYVPVTKAVLSSDGMKMSIYVDPGPLRVGARFDATVTGLYRMGGTPNNSKSTYSMTGLVDSLQAAVDTKLIQPFIGDSNTVCLSVYFNQPMRNQVAYDVTPSVTPSPTPTATPTPGVTSRPVATVTPTPVAELGKWTNNAASVAAMYETAGGATSNVSSSISSVTAYRSANDPGIERLVIDTGSSVSTGTKEYVLALSGFSPNNSSGIAAGNTLNANLKYTTETLGSNSSSYMVHNQGSVINGEATDVVLQINVINAKGNGTLYKQSNTKDKGIPSDYVAVSDANNSNLPVTFLKSNFNSNTVEIGISGGRDQTKFNVKFAPQFPRKFLVTGPNQLITCDNTIAVVAAGTSSSSTPAPAGSVDTATYDTAAGCFTIPFTKAYKWRLSPDEGTDS
ncbi:MAG: hypothetical protein J6P16_00730, partial [Eubacterium sp.]|nr:hypothetical protein [Eubacterium sp.]